MDSFSFTIPQNIKFGAGTLDLLPDLAKELGKSKGYIISGPHLNKIGMVAKCRKALKNAGMESECFTETEGNPSTDTVVKATEGFKKSKADFIVAFGGGSPLDVAKAVAVLATYGGNIVDYEGAGKVMGPVVPMIAIPTTAGTGSEVTAFSVITDYDKGIKYPLADFNITPDIAIVDSALAETMPKKLVAHTGMDAMTHAIEAYVSTLHCNYTDAVALHAIKMIHKELKKSFDGCMTARAEMHDAQCLAGMAFSNALLGIVHSMAHKTGAAYTGDHIIHGCANAMYLPKVIKYNAKNEEAAERYAQIADHIGLGGTTTTEKVDALIAELRSMNDQLDIPQAIKFYGAGGVKAETSIIDEAEFLEKLPIVAANAIGDACTGSNPRQPSQEEMEKLLKACYYDLEIDF